MRTTAVVLTWNRINVLIDTISRFTNLHPDVNIIVVDNGSTDGTAEFLSSTDYDIIYNGENLGAQMGKFIGWQMAVKLGYDFILFIEDDHQCFRTVPIDLVESYLDINKEVGIVRLNDKPYLKRHQITRLPIKKYEVKLIGRGFSIAKYNYHFTSHPSIFRTTLVDMLKSVVVPQAEQQIINIDTLGLDNSHKNYEIAKERVTKDFGVTEKEYMRLYLLNYRFTGQLVPACFKYIHRKRMTGWKN